MTVPLICGVLLAGGQSRRMGGGDKCLLEINGQTVLSRVISRIAPQVQGVVLNVNGDGDRFADYGLETIADAVGDFSGPLAGVLTGMEWAQDKNADGGDISHILSVPTDAPFLPMDLVERLQAPIQSGQAEMTCAVSNGRTHPVVGIWPVSLAADLRRAMVDEDIRKVDRWTARYRLTQVEFDATLFDPFFNMNRGEDLAEAKRLAKDLPKISQTEPDGRD